MIDKIGYTKPASVARAEAKRRASGTGSTQFSDMLDALDDAGVPDAVVTSTPIASTGMFLGLQEISEEEVQRKRAYKHGKSTLDALEHMRDGLLMGTLNMTTIRQLETLVKAERADTIDPGLRAILDEIELRAAVEIAKLERAGKV